jgi:hypothetical protein
LHFPAWATSAQRRRRARVPIDMVAGSYKELSLANVELKTNMRV